VVHHILHLRRHRTSSSLTLL